MSEVPVQPGPLGESAELFQFSPVQTSSVKFISVQFSSVPYN